MREPRNPFKLRSAESLGTDSAFLHTFSPKALDLLPDDCLSGKVHIFRSSPGGGKTSLFRLFTPSVLLELHRTHESDELHDVYLRLRQLSVLSDTGPELLGVMLSLKSSYASIQDLSLDNSRKTSLLNALINSRLLLAALRSTLILARLSYPADVERITISTTEEDLSIPDGGVLPRNGKDVYEWARNLEQQICSALYSFEPESQMKLVGHDKLFVLNILTPQSLRLDDRPAANTILTLLDDFHELAVEQRSHLQDYLFENRPPTTIWLAERLEALNSEEVWALGAVTGREYDSPIYLERFWASNQKGFESALTNVAERRIRLAAHSPGSFVGALQSEIEPRHLEDLRTAIKEIEGRIKKRIRDTQRYDTWIESVARPNENIQESAVQWRLLEILIERDINRRQMAFDFSLSEEELRERYDAGVKAAAEFLLCTEFRIPYYFNFSRLTSVSSNNIEQFLAFASEIFEEILSNNLIGKDSILTPSRQEAIIKDVAQERWDDIRRRVVNGRDVQLLLETIREIAGSDTIRPTAPYAPGVTGIGITMPERDKLVKIATSGNAVFQRLSGAIEAAVTQNWLYASLDRRQGKKGQTWLILYLNRWLCVHFDLPLQYGGWRPQKITELSRLYEKN